MTISVYLAAQYSRRRELAAYAADIETNGLRCTSGWLKEDNDAIDQKLMTVALESDIQRYASDDLADICRADVLVAFSEHPDTPTKRGSRHVEFGLALGMGMRCIVVGHRENIFHHLPGVQCYATWPEALSSLTSHEEPVAHG